MDYGCAESALLAGIQESAMRIKFPHLRFSLLLLFSFILLGPSAAWAQENEKDKAQKQIEKRQELERKTLAMLDEVANQALSLRLPENRSLVLAAAADLLWKHDEKRARNLFWDALNNLTLPNNPSTADAKDMTKDATAKNSTAKDLTGKVSANEKAKDLNQYYAVFSLRQEFLRKVAQHDP